MHKKASSTDPFRVTQFRCSLCQAIIVTFQLNSDLEEMRRVTKHMHIDACPAQRYMGTQDDGYVQDDDE